MPVILAPGDYARWLGEEPDPCDGMRPFPADLMRMWPISTRVNKPENDDPSILEPIELATNVVWVAGRPRSAFCPASLLGFPWGGLAGNDGLLKRKIFELRAGF